MLYMSQSKCFMIKDKSCRNALKSKNVIMHFTKTRNSF